VASQRLIVAALLLTVGLVAIEGTVMFTAMPTIVGRLGGLSLFSWAFSVYLLALTVTGPIYGKLADLYGRKPVLIFGASLFLIGSVLCGLSSSMAMLIAFRAVQGLGAGALQPVIMTIIGDLFSIEKRARIQGLTGSVWGIASIAGPAVGGFIADEVGWRWVFFINLPLGLAAISMILLHYSESYARHDHKVDYLGAALLSGAITALLMGLLQGVRVYGWGAPETWSLFGLSAVLLLLFAIAEGRAAEPMVPPSLVRSRVIVVSSLLGILSGGLMFGVSSYVPLFSQGVLGGSAIQAGLLLAPMSLGWTGAAYVSGRSIVRFGYFPSAFAGGACLALGSAGLLPVGEDTSRVLIGIPLTLLGLGMGFTTSATIISVQNAVGRDQRGIATASILFFRTIGGSVSVAVLGALLNSRMTSQLNQLVGIPEGVDANSLLNTEFRAGLSETVLAAMRGALAGALHDVYLVVFAIGLLSLATIFFFPRGQASELAHRPSRESGAASASVETSGD
jgi:EmrB/QacA subfamily drug resistance transporter